MSAKNELERSLEAEFEGLSGRSGRHSAVEAEALTLYGELGAKEVLDVFLKPFVRQNSDHLESIYRRYSSDPRQPALLRSPLSIVVFERLSRDRFALRQRWLPGEDMASLERMSDIWGAPAPFSRNR